jgi:hypothetical protein
VPKLTLYREVCYSGSMKKLLVIPILICVFSTLAFSIMKQDAETVTVQETTPIKQADPSEEKDVLPVPIFAKAFTRIQDDVEGNRFSDAIIELKSMIQVLQNRQKKVIETFFPNEIGTFFESGHQPQLGSIIPQSENFGVLFFRRYENKAKSTIDVNVVYSDSSIEEYVNIIKNSRLVRSLDNTEVIKVNKQFSTLEKYVPEENYSERNIIVHRDLLVNVVANGITNNMTVEALCKEINFSGLSDFLK